MTTVPLPYPIKISNSEAQVWKSCRRRWWLSYYRELDLKRGEREVTGARSLGTRVHLALEGLYRHGEEPAGLLKEIYDHDVAAMNEVGRTQEEVDAVWKEYDMAHAMITGFLDWAEEEGVDDGIEVVGQEEVLEVPSHVENVTLRGKLDQRVVRKVDGARLFRDFKTVQEFATPHKVLPLDEQMKFYQLLEMLHGRQQNDGRDPEWRTDGGLYLMLRKVKRTANAKPPFYSQLEVHHNMEEIRSMYLRVAKVVEEIVETRRALDADADHRYVVPPRPSRDCTWSCAFFPVCSMLDDGSNSEAMLADYYEHRDPHERYDRDETKGEISA